eukprot:XP_001707625.1 Hypothetical protein GL50803_19396 [Giardia lamblia ATCC 50803]
MGTGWVVSVCASVLSLWYPSGYWMTPTPTALHLSDSALLRSPGWSDLQPALHETQAQAPTTALGPWSSLALVEGNTCLLPTIIPSSDRSGLDGLPCGLWMRLRRGTITLSR